MSVMKELPNIRIENLSVEELCEALIYNGYAEFVNEIKDNFINGDTFLKLTATEIYLMNLQPVQIHRLCRLVEHLRENPENFVFPFKMFKAISPLNINVNINWQNNFQASKHINQSQLILNPPKEKEIEVVDINKDPKSLTLTKDDSSLIKGKLEQLLVQGPEVKVSKSPTKTDKEENIFDANDGYLLPIEIEPPAVLKTSPVQKNSTFYIETPEENVIPSREVPLPYPRQTTPDPMDVSSKPKSRFIFSRLPLFILGKKKVKEPEEPEVPIYIEVLEDEIIETDRPYLPVPRSMYEEITENHNIPLNLISQLKLSVAQRNESKMIEKQHLQYETIDSKIESKEVHTTPITNSKLCQSSLLLPLNRLNIRRDGDFDSNISSFSETSKRLPFVETPLNKKENTESLEHEYTSIPNTPVTPISKILFNDKDNSHKLLKSESNDFLSQLKLAMSQNITKKELEYKLLQEQEKITSSNAALKSHVMFKPSPLSTENRIQSIDDSHDEVRERTLISKTVQIGKLLPTFSIQSDDLEDYVVFSDNSKTIQSSPLKPNVKREHRSLKSSKVSKLRPPPPPRSRSRNRKVEESEHLSMDKAKPKNNSVNLLENPPILPTPPSLFPILHTNLFE